MLTVPRLDLELPNPSIAVVELELPAGHPPGAQAERDAAGLGQGQEPRLHGQVVVGRVLAFDLDEAAVLDREFDLYDGPGGPPDLDLEHRQAPLLALLRPEHLAAEELERPALGPHAVERTGAAGQRAVAQPLEAEVGADLAAASEGSEGDERDHQFRSLHFPVSSKSELGDGSPRFMGRYGPEAPRGDPAGPCAGSPDEGRDAGAAEEAGGWKQPLAIIARSAAGAGG